MAAVVGFFALGLHRSLSLDALKARRADLAALVQRHPSVSILAYLGIYTSVTALSLPGAAVLTLAGGALFGLRVGVASAAVAATAGSTLAFLSIRYLFRDFVRRRWGARLEPINRGIESEGPYYLLTLRLVPLFPFFLINAALGLTRMRTVTFSMITLVGMLPGTFLYAFAGTQLGRLNSPRDVLSPPLLASLALLGLFPLAARFVVKRWRRWQV